MPRSDLPPGLGDEFRWRDARQRGVSNRRLSASDLSAEFRGSRSRRLPVPEGDEFEVRFALLVRTCRAYLPVAPVEFRFTHVTAARLYRIPLPWKLEKRANLDVTVSGSSAPRRAGIIGHRTSTLPAMAAIRGLPVLPVEQVWIQLAAILTLDDLIVAGDFLTRRKSPLSSLAKLGEAVANAGTFPGVSRARSALVEIRPGTDSPMESKLRLLIVRAGLPEPVIGHTVYFEGAFIGTPDLAYIRERIALDYDGKVHRASERAYLDDVERRNLFADAHWRYITVTKDNIRVPRSLLARLERLLADQ